MFLPFCSCAQCCYEHVCTQMCVWMHLKFPCVFLGVELLGHVLALGLTFFFKGRNVLFIYFLSNNINK